MHLDGKQSHTDFRTFFRDEVGKKEASDRQRGNRRSFSDWIFLRLGAATAYFFLKTPITAPQVLIIMLLSGVVGPLLIAQATTGLMAAGISCLAISTWMDSVDGVVYRHRGEPAVRGAFLDRFNHALIYPLTYTAFGFAAYRLTDDWRYLVCGMAAGMFRDAYETLCMYETNIINANQGTVERVRARSFFREGIFKTAKFWWVTPFFFLRNGTNLLSVHALAYTTMLLGVVLGQVPLLVLYFLILYATRFLSYAVITFGVTFRGK